MRQRLIAPVSLKAHALALLARREYSVHELRARLAMQAQRIAEHEAQVAWQQTVTGFERDGDASVPDEAEPTRPSRPSRQCKALSSAQQAAIEEVLAWLTAQRYQSDARFAQSRINQRASSHGTRAIKAELSERGVALDEQSSAQLRASEAERAQALWLRRFGPEPASDAKERARQGNFLLRRGFAADVVRRVVEGRSG